MAFFKAQEFLKLQAVGFLLQFKAEFDKRGMPYQTSYDQREISFQWQGVDMRLTAMDNGYIMAGEKRETCGIETYDITSDRAIWLSDYIADYRKTGEF